MSYLLPQLIFLFYHHHNIRWPIGIVRLLMVLFYPCYCHFKCLGILFSSFFTHFFQCPHTPTVCFTNLSFCEPTHPMSVPHTTSVCAPQNFRMSLHNYCLCLPHTTSVCAPHNLCVPLHNYCLCPQTTSVSPHKFCPHTNSVYLYTTTVSVPTQRLCPHKTSVSSHNFCAPTQLLYVSRQLFPLYPPYNFCVPTQLLRPNTTSVCVLTHTQSPLTVRDDKIKEYDLRTRINKNILKNRRFD